MNVAEAEKNFAMLVNKVYVEGISVDLESDDKVIARLIPAEPYSPLTVERPEGVLADLPLLGEMPTHLPRMFATFERVSGGGQSMGLMVDTNVFIRLEKSGEPLDFSRWESSEKAFADAL